MNTIKRLAVTFVLIASFSLVQMEEVDMLFKNNIDHMFITTANRDVIHAGNSPDMMEL